MRVPLPVRDYFPARVLLRGAPRPKPRLIEAWSGLPALRPRPASLPASPPTPMVGMQPAAA